MVTISQVISRGFRGAKANLLVLLGASLLSICLVLPVPLILYFVMFFLPGKFDPDSSLRIWVMQLGLIIVVSLLTMGWITISLKIVRGGTPKIRHIFTGLKRAVSTTGFACFFFFGTALLNNLVLLVDFPAMGGLEEILGRMLFFVFALLVFFTPWFMADKDMSLPASISTAMKTIWAYRVFLFLLSLGLLFYMAAVLFFFSCQFLLGEEFGRSAPLGLFFFAGVTPLFFIFIGHVFEGITKAPEKAVSKDQRPGLQVTALVWLLMIGGVLSFVAINGFDGRGGRQSAADIGSFHPERSFKDSGGASGFTWSPDGRQLASPHGSTLKIWDATSGKEAHTLAGYNKDMPAFSISWSPDGKRLAAGGGDALRVWDVSSGKTIYSIEASPIGSTCVAWSPDGKKVAGCGGEKITVWDIGRKEELWSGKGHSAPLGTLAWSPDGMKLASGSWDRTVVIWDPTTGKIIKSLSAGRLAVYQVAWSPDGTKIAACGDNNNTVSRKTVLVWEVGSWEEFDQLVGHSTGPALSRSLAWSPDGHSLLTGGERGHIKVWDINISKVRQTLTGNGGPVLYLGWSPDGTRIAAKGVTAGPYGLSTWLLAK